MAKHLNISQLRAIKKAALLGRKIQKEFPQIAKDYRNGLSKPKIAEKYNIESRYNVGINVAQNAIGLALRGHQGHLRTTPYEGLIKNKKKLEQLASEHQAISFNSLTKKQRSKNGKKAYELGLGIHGFTTKQRKENNSKAGKIARDKKLGVHAASKQQNAKWRRKAMIASGKVPYKQGEKERVFELVENPNFQSGQRGPSYDKIKQQINIEFHKGAKIRTRSSINYVLFRAKLQKIITN
jgi:hypothetical protein